VESSLAAAAPSADALVTRRSGSAPGASIGDLWRRRGWFSTPRWRIIAASRVPAGWELVIMTRANPDRSTPPDEDAESRELDAVPADQDENDDREAADPRPASKDR